MKFNKSLGVYTMLSELDKLRMSGWGLYSNFKGGTLFGVDRGGATKALHIGDAREYELGHAHLYVIKEYLE